MSPRPASSIEPVAPSTVSCTPNPSSGIGEIAARRYGACMNGSGDVAHLVDRHPSVTPERLIEQLIPPPTFADVSFDTYNPDPAEPSQAAAVRSCQQFCEQAVARRSGKKKLFGRRET